MTKIAFCFPGQGSLEAGMGREIAEAVPEAMEVYERGSEACGLDLEQLCFEDAARGAGRDRGAAAGARRDEPRDAGGAADARHQAGRTWSATRSASSRRSPRRESVGDARDDRARPRARARDGRGGEASAPARWPRSSGSTTTWSSALPEDPRRVAGELQLPRPDRGLGRERGGRRVLRRGRGGGRAPRRSSSRSRARSTARSSRGPPSGCRPAIDRIKFAEPQAAFMSTVTARFEAAQRLGALLVDQLTAPVRFTQAAVASSMQGRREDVRRGRAGQRPLRAGEADRPQREAVSVNDLATLEKAPRSALERPA